jgi:serine protease AprX
MAKKRIIAYFMHESEQLAAAQLMPGAKITDSFAIGEIDENDENTLRREGLIIQEEPLAPPSPIGSRSFSLETPAAASLLKDTWIDTLQNATPSLVDYYVIRLRGPILEEWRQQLDATNVILLEWIPDRGYKARLRMDQVQIVKALDFVDTVTWIDPEQSALQIDSQALPATGPGEESQGGLRMLTFDVRLHRPEDLATVKDWLQTNHISIAGSSARKIRIYLLENSQLLAELASLPQVDMVAEYVTPQLWNDAARRLLSLDSAPMSNPATYLTQDGKGQIVAIADTGIDDQHPDFQGRIVGKIARGRPNDTSDPVGHGTHVAGSVLGDGTASGGQIKGTAPGASLFFQSLLDATGRLGGLPIDLNDLFDEAYKAGARIHNNSWGAATPSSYTINSEEVDEFVRNHPDMLIVIAAGNAGTSANPKKAAIGFVDWLSVSSPASCKNALTVGASRSDRTDGPLSLKTWGSGWPASFPNPPIATENVSGDPNCLAAFSSRGPTDDRRIKPDLVAPGTDIASTKSSLAPIGNFWGAYPTTPAGPPNPRYAFDGGTSMAAPLVAGCAALVRQYYLEDRHHEPSAALLKATLINSTRWLSGNDSTAPSAGVPNYHQGHGRICMQMAIPNPSRRGFNLQFVDDWKNPNLAFVRTGQRRRFQLNLPAGSQELRICMAYTDVAARGLQNNVNLMVQHIPTGTKWVGNATLPDLLTLPDPDNNVEVVRIQTPSPGTYLIQIFAGNLLKVPQDFALVATGVSVPALSEI